MGLFNRSPKKETHTTCVEVLKGQLKKDAVVDSSKVAFAENENLIECIFIIEGADEKLMTMARDRLGFTPIISPDFTLSYLIQVNTEKKIDKITAIISEGIEDTLVKLLEENKFILRIQK